MKTAALALSLAITLLVGTTAHGDDVNGAAKAFSQAQEAQLGGDLARAADLYELADELAPSAPALRNAARARLAAGHLAAAATNAAALLRRYPSDKESRDIAEAILSKLGPQLAQLDVRCSAACTLLVDGKVVASVAREQHALFIQPGARTISAAFEDGRKASNPIAAGAGQITSVQLDAPPQAAAEPKLGAAPEAGGIAAGPAAAPSRGLSRKWAIGGAVVTVGLGVATAISGMSTLATRDEIRDAVAADDTASAMRLYDSGRSAQSRTNILLGATAGAGALTIALAVFTNWSGGETREVAVVPTGDGAAVVWGRAF